MKKNIALLLAMVMALALFGCGAEPAETPQHTTLPTHATIPETTTPETHPPETTVSAQTQPQQLTIEMHPYYDAFLEAGFVYGTGELFYYSGTDIMSPSDVSFLYTGESNVIQLDALDLTLTLPEEWMGQVAVYQSCSDTASKEEFNGICQVYSRNIIAANRNKEELTQEELTQEDLKSGVWVGDYLFCIWAEAKSEYFSGDPRNPEFAIFLGESETHFYYLRTPETQDPDCSELLLARSILMDRIGEDAYWELVGDLKVTPDEIQNMIQIHNKIEAPAE